MNSLAARVKAFEDIRDLEYRFDFLDRSRDTTCLSKATRLKAVLADFGIESRHICCRHRWSETLPLPLTGRAPAEEGQHHYLEVLVPETRRWTAVDPTWDSGLKAAGFPVAEWDGINPTILAVKPFATFSPERSDGIRRVIDGLGNACWVQMQNLYGPFYDDLNAWIASQRTPTTGKPGSIPAGRHYA